VHGASKQLIQASVHHFGVFPVVGGTGVGLADAANIGAIFHAGDIAGVGTGQKAVGTQFLIEFDKRATVNQQLIEGRLFFG